MKKQFLIPILGIGLMISACGGESKTSEKTDSATETASTSEEIPGKKLIDANDCKSCHAIDSKVVGPAFLEIAKKYPNTDENVNTLIHKVMKGGSGNWGDIPMAAHPNLSESDAKEMVHYILSIKP